ncbi:DUF2497 domain-containing protein [Croceicoccus sp. YJ47]|uniref:DUF2497 domain-containing protein n=1 Tax=Croceicoccus sp. YJ47 TaxID=2798724 RepID=UPI001920C2EB|nr:DUF2497 domain-containing protein [Croceicoccus sp. YJ47]QQN75404.1 DUF2497 domain-containing protein [Croceicoccus sp. YJ47]
MPQDGEQSVDEILRSIKKVIIRDDRHPSGGDAPMPRRNEPARHDAGAQDADWHERDRADRAASNDMPDDFAQDGREADGDAPLIENAARDAIGESLAALSGLSATPPSANGPPNNALEEMIREMLRPMLKQWLDDNLPEIVERIVQREVRRITGRS